ncbi:MAG: peptidoglycan-binding protein [Ilumatobacteraceae bacterium]
MPRRFLAIAALTLSVFTADAAVALPFALAPNAAAVAAPWTTPTSPPRCTAQQANDGDVAACVLMAGPGLPESRGWPVAPFPAPENQTVVAWVDLSLGMKDSAVAKVQEALNRKAGTALVADGQFGSQTLTAVKAFQTANQLTANGVVTKTMADLLGVQRTTGGTFPPKGWVWSGWGYNGSPALTVYASKLVGNTAPVGAMKVGQLRSFGAALPLFVGFYSEIQAKGYSIRNGGTWVFRCTASTRKDCAGQTKYSLSNHAFGLASDINTVENPMARYYASGTTSACAVPMKTDMPRWVVQIAEKWGLYWGGYGWTSGCQSPSHWRSSVSRDPMHFEFNGTPQQAQAILRRNTGSGVCIDVVNSSGQPINWCLMKGEVPKAATRLAVSTKAPSGAGAALVSVTTSGAVTNGSLTAEDCAARSNRSRPYANARVRIGRTSTDTMVVPLDANGRFCLFQSSAFHTSVTVEAFFSTATAAPTGNLFTPTSQRTLSTKSTTWCTPLSVCSAPSPVPAGTLALNTAASALTPVAAWANLHIGRPAADGTASIGLCTAPTRRVASLSALDSATSRSLVTPALSTEMGVQFCTTATQAVNATVDVTGVFAPASQGGLGYDPARPAAIADTRGCWTDAITGGQRCAQMLDTTSRLQLPPLTPSTVAVLNVAALGGTRSSVISLAACDGSIPSQQVLVFDANGDRDNVITAQVPANGLLCVRTTSPAHVAVSSMGAFTPTGALRYVPVTPVQVYSTR